MAGTSGYNISLDLRYHWMMQKRLQGSHLANDDQAAAVNGLVISGKVDPCLSATYDFDEIGQAHQLMHENKHPYGNMACLVNATDERPGSRLNYCLGPDCRHRRRFGLPRLHAGVCCHFLV